MSRYERHLMRLIEGESGSGRKGGGAKVVKKAFLDKEKKKHGSLDHLMGTLHYSDDYRK